MTTGFGRNITKFWTNGKDSVLPIQLGNQTKRLEKGIPVSKKEFLTENDFPIETKKETGD